MKTYGEVEIAKRDGKEKVRALTSAKRPLVVAELVARVAGVRESGHYTITHVRTGKQVCPGFLSISAAKRALTAILPLADWTLSEEECLKVKGLKAKVEAAAQRAAMGSDR